MVRVDDVLAGRDGRLVSQSGIAGRESGPRERAEMAGWYGWVVWQAEMEGRGGRLVLSAGMASWYCRPREQAERAGRDGRLGWLGGMAGPIWQAGMAGCYG